MDIQAEPRLKSVFDANPDYRRNPKSDYYCINCYQALARNKPHRLVVVTVAGDEFVHPEDCALVPDASLHPFGNDCAKRLGMEWTLPAIAQQKQEGGE